MRELNIKEIKEVTGGNTSSPWYWVGYAIGATVDAVSDAASAAADWINEAGADAVSRVDIDTHQD